MLLTPPSFYANQMSDANMKRRRCTCVVAVLACVLASYAPAQSISEHPGAEKVARQDSVEFENAYVRVVRHCADCTSVQREVLGTRVIVALTATNIHDSKGVHQLERGQVGVVRGDESYTPVTGEYFEVTLKKDHPPLKTPEQWIEPTGNKIVYEDEQFRVFEERLEGGGERPLHSHAQRLVVRLNEVQLTDPRFHETPRPGSGIQVPNTVKFAEPMVHVVRNVSGVPLFNIVIEFKVPQSK
jgi:hypothetical protein